MELINLKVKTMLYWLLLITKGLLDYIVPDFVHVLFDGKIVKSGGKN